MRFVAGPAAFKAHHSMLEREWAALVAVALETARFVGPEGLCHRRPHAPVRIMAIDAGHCPFCYPVMERLLELAPDRGVTTRALFVDGRSLARHQSGWPVDMNLVTGGAGNLILRMAALQTADVGWLIQMTGQTDFVRSLRREFRRIADVLR